MRYKSESIHNLVVLGLIIAICAIAIYALGVDLTNESSSRKTYYDDSNGFSFKYPGNFVSQKISSIGIDIVEIYPSYQYHGTSSLIEITCADDTDPRLTFQDELSSLREKVGNGQVTRLSKKDIPAIQVVKYESGERTITSYFKANGKIFALRMNQSYYDNSNPLVLNNNSLYTGVYFRILNSLSFY